MKFVPMYVREIIFAAAFVFISLSSYGQLCVGTTAYYSCPGTSTKFSWSISGGGTLIGSNRSCTIAVEWTSPGVHYVYYSDNMNSNNDYTYTVNVGGVIGGSVTPSTSNICAESSVTLTLSGRSGTIVRWEKSTNGGASWQTISNTSATYNTGALSATTMFRAVVSKCSSTAYSTAATVSVVYPNAGGVSLSSGKGSFCSGESASGTLVVSGYSGTAMSWEKSVASGGTWGAWEPAGGLHDVDYYNFSVNVSTRIRAKISSGTCGTIYSGYYTIAETQATVAGSISGPTVICPDTPFSLSLNGNVGTIQGWYRRDADHGYGGSIGTPSNITINKSSYFKAVVRNGNCDTSLETPEFYVSVIPGPSVGTLSPALQTVCSGEEFTITLSHFSGTAVKWQRQDESTNMWTTVVENSNLSYTHNEAQASGFWRALVENECGVTTASIPVEVQVMQPPAKPINITDDWIYGEGATNLKVTVDPSCTVKWYDDELAVDPPVGTGVSYTTPSLLVPTAYYVRSFDAYGCPSDLTLIEARFIDNLVSPSNVEILTIRKSGITTESQFDALTEEEKTTQYLYLDGFGRTVQTVTQKGSPQGNDIVQPVEYNALGHIGKQYLPYTDGNDGSFKSTYRSDQSGFYAELDDQVANDDYPFAISSFEESPLERITGQGMPGESWQAGSGHASTIDYSFNNGTIEDAAEEVRKFNPDGTSSDFFSANKLRRTETTDPDGNKTITFSDSRGQILAKKVQLDEVIDGSVVQWLETYYVYGAQGELKYIISPKGVAALKEGGWLLTQAILDQYVNQFIYDRRGRLIEKKAPGQAWIYNVYDDLNRLVLSQDGSLRETNKWSFIKYDQRSRVVMQGLYLNTTATTRESMQDDLDDLYSETNASFPYDAWYESKSAGLHGYTNRTFPKENSDGTDLEVLTVNYYDSYDFDNDGVDDFTYAAQGLDGETSPNDRVTGLSVGSKRLVLGTSTWLYQYVFYDKYYRPIQVRSNNHLSAAIDNLSTFVYDFEGKLKVTKIYHDAGAGKVMSVVNTFFYDDKGRLEQISQNNNNQPTDQIVVQYEYNELGQLVDKRLHQVAGEEFLQSVDFRYTILGQLASINSAELTTSEDDDFHDYFGMELHYDDIETGLGNTPRYNGNISAVRWQGPGATLGVEDEKSYVFSYDKSGKLKEAAYQMHSEVAWEKEVGNQNESMAYDHNGNITSLQRNQRKHQLSGVVASYASQTIDDLTYTYNNSFGDRLEKVVDDGSEGGFNNGGSGTDSDYTYDLNGSLTSDKNKGIDSIHYNFLGKVRRIKFADGTVITYSYDAMGVKLTMKHYAPGNSTPVITDYVGGFVYENGELRFFGSPEGRVVKNGSNFEYQYAIADHQGNTRVVFSSATPSVETPTTGFESDPGDLENYPSGGNLSDLPLFNQTPGGTHSQLLNGGYSSQVGIAKSFKVYPGDKVKIQAYAKYEDVPGPGNAQGFATALLQAFSLPAPAAGETGTPSHALDTWGGFVDEGIQDDEAAPLAFVNIVIFDKNFDFLDAAWTQINASAKQVGVSPDVPHDELIQEYSIDEEGYVFIYVSNNSPLKVYFDDVTFTHTPTNVIQYNEYYPFGLQTSNSWTRDNNSNRFLFNAGTELNSSSGLYETMFRSYDPALGRFIQVDPLANMTHNMSPYQYANCNPILLNDPLGLMSAAEIDAIIGDLYGSPNGGNWSSDGGTHYYDSQDEAYKSGAGYNDQHESWGYTAYGGRQGSNFVYQSIKNGVGFDQISGSNRNLVVYEPTGAYYQVDASGIFYLPYSDKTVDPFGGVVQRGEMQQGGLGWDLSLAFLSTASYAVGVYEEVRAGQIANNTMGYLKEWQSIRNFNKSYRMARQATLVRAIIKNANMIDGIKLGARRMIGVGTVIGLLDVANSKPEERMGKLGWVAADAVMAGVGLTGWGAPIAGAYFLGRFAYGIYEMANKD